MAASSPPSSSSPSCCCLSFFEFPEDVQISILSFLLPPGLTAFSVTSRRSSALCARPNLFLSLCLRRWGEHTLLRLWPPLPPPLLYRALLRCHRLLGFWRRVGPSAHPPHLLLFRWGPSSVAALGLVPSSPAGSVAGVPFAWVGASRRGEVVAYVRVGQGREVVRGEVSFMGEGHLVLEERWDYCRLDQEEEEVVGRVAGSGWRLVGRDEEGVWRMGRRRKWETEHFARVADCSPTSSRPLQGLWMGLAESMKLEFFLVTYDDIGGIACRRVGDSLEPFSSYSPVFWTSSTTFLDPPFSREEEEIYSSREHIRPLPATNHIDAEEETVARILCINSSYDLVLPNLYGPSTDLRNVEGRIWLYRSGNFGFGFLRNNFIVDMKPIAMDGSIQGSIV